MAMEVMDKYEASFNYFNYPKLLFIYYLKFYFILYLKRESQSI